MNIGIDLGWKEERQQSVFNNYLMKSLRSLALHHPEHSFIIYNSTAAQESFPKNLSTSKRSDEKDTWVSQLFKKRKKEGPDYLIERFDATRRVTSGSAVMIQDLGGVVYPQLHTEREIRRFKKLIGQAINNAVAVIVPSLYYSNLLTNQFRVPAEKMHLFRLTIPPVKTFYSWEEKERIKETYTKGKEYFLYAGDLDQRFDLLTLLKAFSQFKKWQKSNMQLVIAGYETARSPLTKEIYSTYKYREEVMLMFNPSEQVLSELTAAAYAFVYPALYDPFPLTVLQAISMQVPVISSDFPELRELAGDSVIYTEMKEQPLSAIMQKVYKDEAWRTEMIMKATEQVKRLQEVTPVSQQSIDLNELIAK
jgi:glycosyltransferase involved in cell wall biosynthesis